MSLPAANVEPRWSWWIGRSWIVVAAVLWSTSGFFAKAPVFHDWAEPWRASSLVFWRGVFACLILAPFVRRVRWSWRLVPLVSCFAAMNWAFINALVSAEASVAIWLQYTAPVWVFLGSLWLFGETIRARDWLFLLAASTGTAVIILFQIQQTSGSGLVYGLLAGVFYAGVILSLRSLRHFDSFWLIFLNHLVTALVFLPVLVQSGIFPVGSQWWYLIGFGAAQMAIPYVLFARGLKNVSGHEAAGISLLEPILVPVWVFLAWRHAADYAPPTPATIVGASLILIALLLRYWRATPRSANTSTPG